MDKIADDIANLQDWGVQNLVLGVVPGLFSTEDGDFLAQLQQWQEQGFELMVHGWKHQSDLDLPRSFCGRALQKITANEAEFAGLSKKDATKLLHHSYEHWEKLGLGQAVGFVAPTWWGSANIVAEALQLWPWVESRFALYSQDINLSSIAFSFAGFPPQISALALRISMFGVGLINSVPRLVLHPGDTKRNFAPLLRKSVENWLVHRKAFKFNVIS